jgi:hypothetical protein
MRRIAAARRGRGSSRRNPESAAVRREREEEWR